MLQLNGRDDDRHPRHPTAGSVSFAGETVAGVACAILDSVGHFPLPVSRRPVVARDDDHARAFFPSATDVCRVLPDNLRVVTNHVVSNLSPFTVSVVVLLVIPCFDRVYDGVGVFGS